MLNVKKKANLKIFCLIIAIILGWLGHDFLADKLEIVKNYGISFGLEINWLFLVGIVLFLSFFWVKNKRLDVGIILVGGIINLIDRLYFGYVRDYWQFFLVYNNLADWLIGVGIGLFFIKFLWKESRK